MVRCPNCGSTAQVKVVNTEYNEDGWDLEVVRVYKCRCGQMFTGTSYFHCPDAYEIIESFPKRLSKG